MFVHSAENPLQMALLCTCITMPTSASGLEHSNNIMLSLLMVPSNTSAFWEFQ